MKGSRHIARRGAVLALAFTMLTPNTAALADSTYTRGQWKQTKGSWFFMQDEQEVSGWIFTEQGWFYIDPASKRMKSGWLTVPDGHRYFLNTVHDGSFGKMLTGWHWIDGKCYYFQAGKGEQPEGALLTGKKTPDGYTVSSSGAWVDESGREVMVPGKGIITSQGGISFSGGKSGVGKSGVGKSGSGKSGSGKSGDGKSSSGKSGGSSSAQNGKSGQTGKMKGDAGQTGHQSGTPGSIPAPGNSAKPGGKSGQQAPDEDKPGNLQEDHKKPETEAEREHPENAVLLKKSHTKIVPVEGTSFLVITFATGTIADYRVMVDGADVTEACTKIDDEGTMVKWALTSGGVRALTVENQNGETDSLVLDKKLIPGEPSAGSPSDLPRYILSAGKIPTYDKFGKAHDSQGNEKYFPEYTTFDFNGTRVDKSVSAKAPRAYYCDTVLLDKDRRGQIRAKLALTNADQERWFKEIRTVRFLGENGSPLNNNVKFRLEYDESHGHTGIIVIDLPQVDMSTTGVFKLNLSSAYDSGSISFPVHLARAEAYHASINSETANPECGQKIIFNIEGENGESFGNDLVPPIYRVIMTDPDGEETELTNQEGWRQWAQIGYLFEVFPTPDRPEEYADKGEMPNFTKKPGMYTFTIFAKGYRTITAVVEVHDRYAVEKVQGNEPAGHGGTGAALAKKAMHLLKSVSGKKRKVDTVASASGVVSMNSDSDVSDGGGTSMSNGYLLFDYDLLANAMLLNKLAIPTKASNEVMSWYLGNKNGGMAPIAFVANDRRLYDFGDFITQVDMAKKEGGYLTFAEYLSSGRAKLSGNTPNQIKVVLEDGRLSSAEPAEKILGERPNPDAPVQPEEKPEKIVQVEEPVKGKNYYYFAFSGEYDDVCEMLSAADLTVMVGDRKLKPVKNLRELDKNSYFVQTAEENGEVLPFGICIGTAALPSRGIDVSFSADGFRKTSVYVEKGQELEDDTIKPHDEKKPEDENLQGQQNDNIKTDGKKLPAVKKAVLVNDGGINIYRCKVVLEDNEDSKTEDYFKAQGFSAEVNGVPYTWTGRDVYLSQEEGTFGVTGSEMDIHYAGRKDCFIFRDTDFTKRKNKIVIHAEGYQDLIVYVENPRVKAEDEEEKPEIDPHQGQGEKPEDEHSGLAGGEQKPETDNSLLPTVKDVVKESSLLQKAYILRLTSADEGAVEAYLKSESTLRLQVEDTVYKKYIVNYAAPGEYFFEIARDMYGKANGIKFNLFPVQEGKETYRVTLSQDGYEDIVFMMSAEGKLIRKPLSGGEPEKTEEQKDRDKEEKEEEMLLKMPVESSASVYKHQWSSGLRLRLRLRDTAKSQAADFLKAKELTAEVNGEEYTLVEDAGKTSLGDTEFGFGYSGFEDFGSGERRSDCLFFGKGAYRASEDAENSITLHADGYEDLVIAVK